MHCYKPRKPTDLISMTHHSRVFKSASAFASHVHDLHKEIRKKIRESNAHYKSHTDLHHMHLKFNEDDSVMIRIRPERFPSGTIKKLHTRRQVLIKVSKKLIQMPMSLIYLQILGLVRYLIFRTL